MPDLSIYHYIEENVTGPSDLRTVHSRVSAFGQKQTLKRATELRGPKRKKPRRKEAFWLAVFEQPILGGGGSLRPLATGVEPIAMVGGFPQSYPSSCT